MGYVAAVFDPLQGGLGQEVGKASGVLGAQNFVLTPPENQRGQGDLGDAIAQKVVATTLGKGNQRLGPVAAAQVQRRTQLCIRGDEGLVGIGLSTDAAAHPRIFLEKRWPSDLMAET